MDDDGMRRGQPSNHIKFSEATAILAGDALQALAFETIASSKGIIDAHKVEAVRMLAEACGHQGMILGQQYDLDAEKNELLDIELIHSLKTGKLIQVALHGHTKSADRPSVRSISTSTRAFFAGGISKSR